MGTAFREPALRGFADLGRCRVMGVINVTPDSFSDGGEWFDHEAAVRHGLSMWAQGADIIDVGGESTRPGAIRIDTRTELDRVLPVVAALAESGVVVSVDTMRAEVAAGALDVGAQIVNDVSGGLADPEMAAVVAGAGVPIVVMHWRGHSERMQDLAVYTDVVQEVRSELARRMDELVAAGVDAEQIVLDPGLGFAKNADHNWALLAQLDQLMQLGRPVLVGASRKAFLGRLLADAEGVPRGVKDREAASVAVSTAAALAGAWAVRVHDVRADIDAVRVAARLRAEGNLI